MKKRPVNMPVHCITGQDDRKEENKEDVTNSWINKYIFSSGYVPSVNELIYHIASEKLCLTDVEDFRRHYGKTLEIWIENF